MDPTQNSARVMVAMSGGVDSTAAALLLKEAVFAIKGVYMSLWHHADDENQLDQAQRAAQLAAEALGIDFEVLSLKDRFHELIVGSYLDALSAGLTPNPCVFCNKVIKWGLLMDFAQSQGFNFLASGHYARLITDTDGGVRLLKGVDQTKDQSYVLSTLDQRTLRHMLLPLGDKTKLQVKEILRQKGYQLENKHESQDLCFLNGISQDEFLAQYAPQLVCTGEIIDQNGKILGRHKGLAFYTIGQRKGLGISSAEPLYVIEKDVATNRLIVGLDLELSRFGLNAKAVNWISGTPPDITEEYSFKTRYTAKIVTGRIINLSESEFSVKFESGLRDITPGQRVAVYDKNICLGSGEITGSLP